MKKSKYPITRVKNSEPKLDSPDWVIWAAWADRITFEEIKKKTGIPENEVIKIMRRSLKKNSFKLWRKRVKNKSIKHQKKFKFERKEIRRKIKKSDYII
jgi:TIGR03643 family protein